MNRLTGPLSRGSMPRSSPVRIASRTLVELSARAARLAAACSLRVRGTLARALRAASASLRVGVGRPFLPVATVLLVPATGVASTGAGLSVLVRRNKALLPVMQGMGCQPYRRLG